MVGGSAVLPFTRLAKALATEDPNRQCQSLEVVSPPPRLQATSFKFLLTRRAFQRINAANSDDAVLVAPGTYYEKLRGLRWPFLAGINVEHQYATARLQK